MKFLDLCKSKVLVKGALFSAIFFSLLLASLAFAPGAKAGANSPTFNNDADGTECAWVSDANINCGDVEYWFDLDLTVSKGRAMYHARFEDNWQNGYIIFEDDGTTGQIVNSPDVTTDGTDATILDREKRLLRRYAENDNPDTPRDNGEIQSNYVGAFVPGGSTGEQYFFCGLYSGADQKCWSGRGGAEKKVSADAAALLERLSEDITATVDSDENCAQDSGALGFVLCPMLKGIQNAIDALIGTDGSSKGFIVELLTIKPLDQATTPELYRGWEAVRNIALALYVLIFALIIFGNGVGYDPYTIKRALPRLAAGVVLTFASFFIMQTVIDVSNFLGNMVPAFVNWMSTGTAVTTFNFDVNFAYQGISIILIIVFAVVALGALLVGLAGLITRVVIIYGLVLLAPLAFLAWVLPNTEGMFKKWWKNLIKVAMMFPIVTGMLSLSLFFAKIMSQTASSTNNGVLAIAASLAPLIAIILIPKTFKWGGEAFAAAAGYMAGKATSGKEWGKSKGGDSFKDGVGAKAMRAVGTKKVMQTNDDGTPKLDENGKQKFKRAPRMGVGRLPGIGGVTKTKAEVAAARRDARIKSRAEEGIKDVSQEGLQRIYQSMNARQRATPQGIAVKGELDKKRGEAFKDYAEAVRTGNDSTFARSKIDEIDGIMGGSYSQNTQDRVHNIGVADRRSKNIPNPGTEVPVTQATAGAASTGAASKARQAWSNRAGQRGQGGYVDPSAWGSSGSSGPAPSGGTSSGPSSGAGAGAAGGGNPAPTTPPPAGGPQYYGGAAGPTVTGGASPWSPPPAAPAPSLPPMTAAPAAPAAPVSGPIPPATPVSVSGGVSSPTPASAPAPTAPSSSGGTTTIVNNNSVNQVFQQSGSLRSQMSGGGLEGYGDLMRKMDGIDAKLASGKVDTFALKKDLKNLRLARESAPESMHGQIDDYMRSAERAAGIPENAGAHDDVDLSEE